MSKDLIEQLKQAAAARNVKLTNQGNGHWQIHGPLLVNYYPMSKNQTAYVAGTIGGHKGISPQKAVAMAFELPSVPFGLQPEKRSKHNKDRRMKVMMLRGNCCHWCKIAMSLEDSTLEHIIPLARGGLDVLGNWVLACDPCNKRRGDKMHELKKISKQWPEAEEDTPW